MIYLDYQATTPPAPEAVHEDWGWIGTHTELFVRGAPAGCRLFTWDGLALLLRGYARPAGTTAPLDLERVGTTEGREVKVSSNRTSVVFRVAADPAVLRGTAWVPFNQPGPNVGELIDCFAAVNDVRIETL